MNKLVLVWILWAVQVVGGISYAVVEKLDEQARLNRFFDNRSRLMDRIQTIPIGTPERTSLERQLSALENVFNAPVSPFREVDSRWILYAVLNSGVFIRLTVWAMKAGPDAQ